MSLSDRAIKELVELSKSDSLRKDMETVASQRHNPFIKDGTIDVDTYIEFLNQFNEFTNHEPKPFQPIIDKEMKL